LRTAAARDFRMFFLAEAMFGTWRLFEEKTGRVRA
jgi:hypothetical protein